MLRTVSISLLAAFAVMLVIPAQAIDVNPFSLIKSAVEAAAEDRSSGDIATDLKIKTAITAAIVDELGTDVISPNVDVYEQDVMLTGAVEDPKLKQKAGQLSKAAEGVKKTYNDILVIKSIDKEKGAVENFVDDTVIESKVNALLLDGTGVNVTNFRWRSVGGRVFLFGRALSNGELKKAIGIVKKIKNVTKVTSRVKVRPKS
ncbi:MAG TPA: BON domain-containing protein [Rhodospirillales bacterium]|nr:BON domain-containing protein [Rhodospirillales bacterium]